MEKKFWAREKWWGLFFAVIIPVINSVFGFGLEATEIAGIMIPFIALIVGDIWEEKLEKLVQLEAVRRNTARKKS